VERKKLEKLLIEEVSGVDFPANGADGWMVRKSGLSAKTARGTGPITDLFLGKSRTSSGDPLAEVGAVTVALAATGDTAAAAQVQQAVGDDRALDLIAKAMREVPAERRTALGIRKALGRPGTSRIF
jgi:hypothetical protein